MMCAMLHLVFLSSLLAVRLVVNSTIPFLQRHRSHAVVLSRHSGGDVLVVVLLIVRLLLVEERVVVEEHLLGQVSGGGVVRHHVADVERQVSNSCALLVARLRLGDVLHEQASGEASNDGEGHRDDHGSKLTAGLLWRGPTSLAPKLLVALPVPLAVRLVEDAVAVAGEYLVEARLGWVEVLLVALVQEGVVRVVHVVASNPSHYDRNETAKDRGHAMEVVDAATIIE